MQRTVDAAFDDVDAVLLVLSTRERIGAGDRFIASRVFSLGVPVVIALNKVDRLKAGPHRHADDGRGEARRLPRAAPGQREDRRRRRELRDDLVALLPEGPPYFPQDVRTDLPVEVQIAELVREQALRLTKEEVPHAITAEVDRARGPRVRVFVYVETESQKQILVGKGGTMVREIGTRARPEIEAVLGRRCSSS